jgi:fumarate reductase subunit C
MNSTSEIEVSETSTRSADERIILVATWIITIALTVIGVVFGIYVLQFGADGLSNNPAIWGQFGDFMGGAANPVLSFLTLNVVVLTLVLQRRQLTLSGRELELSRRELELTREELSRSAQAQELSEQALRAQAAAATQATQLSAVNYLLAHYKSELQAMRAMAFTANDPRLLRMKELQDREKQLLDMLDEMFESVAKQGVAHELQDR